MRKRFHHFRVCSCSPEKGVTYLDTKLLMDIVNRAIRCIRCASTSRHKAHRGLLLGNLCAEARHPYWAVKIWKFTIEQIHDKDYEEWFDVTFNPEYVSLRDVIANGLCEIIGRRIDEVERRYGWSNPHGRDCWDYRAGDGWYDGFRCEKYDYEWEPIREYYIQLRNEVMERQQTERIFREGQGDLPPQSQDFFNYWNDYDPTTEDLYFKIDDWDEDPQSSF